MVSVLGNRWCWKAILGEKGGVEGEKGGDGEKGGAGFGKKEVMGEKGGAGFGKKGVMKICKKGKRRC